MEKIDLPELTLAEIMRNIRAEVQNQPPLITETPVAVSPALNTDFAKLNRYAKEKPFEIKMSYTTADFCQYHDKVFIRHLFQAILKREPDDAGMDYYLSQLRSGKRTKREIIANMRFSKEGRANKVRVKGIMMPFWVALFYRLPLLGYLLKLLVALLKLPKLVEKVHQLEALNQAPKPELVELERYFQEQLSQKATRAELDLKANRFESDLKAARTELALKVTKEELESKTIRDELEFTAIRAGLDLKANWEELDLKANREELNLKANREELDLKANREELAGKVNREELNNKLENKANREEVNIRVDWVSF
jgi:hypothetical protein